jgi:hypothetical protein
MVVLQQHDTMEGMSSNAIRRDEVVKDLFITLHDVLCRQFEHKDIENMKIKLENSKLGIAPSRSELNIPIMKKDAANSEKVSFLATNDKCSDKMCIAIIGFCQQLIAVLDQGIYFQNWVDVFKRKGLNDVANLNLDIIAKVESLMDEIFIKPKTMMRTSDYNGSNVEDDKTKLFQKYDNLVLWITHLQDHHKVCLKLTIFIINVFNFID